MTFNSFKSDSHIVRKYIMLNHQEEDFKDAESFRSTVFQRIYQLRNSTITTTTNDPISKTCMHMYMYQNWSTNKTNYYHNSIPRFQLAEQMDLSTRV